MNVEKQVQKAANLIGQLREVDTDFRVFGAHSHRYHLGPTLSEEELRDFELKHGVELPPDYRLFLKTVGNGNGKPLHPQWGSYGTAGVGPAYGVYRLEGTPMGKRTNKSFPFEQQIKIQSDPKIPMGENIPGLLDIGSKGCEYTTHLVVKGVAYGTVWDGYRYENYSPTGLSFTEWMCKWAEHAIPLVIRERIVKPVEVGMTVQEVVAICNSNGKHPHSIQTNPLSIQRRTLFFEGLATRFKLDEQGEDKVVRIIDSSI